MKAPCASLRERRDEKRGGNAAPWKAWKTSKPSFPLFPPGLEIRQETQTPDFNISTAPTAASINLSGKEKKTVTGIEFQLTRPRHFKHPMNVSVASLRS
jgi:hypothetical protein